MLMARFKQKLAPILTIVVMIVIWQIVVVEFKVPSYLISSPSAIIGELFLDVHWLTHIYVTLYEILAGFLLAIAVGIILGVAIVYSDLLRNTIYPLVVVAQILPKVAIAPLFLVWLGFGDLPKVLITFLIAFFPIVINTAVGLGLVEQELLDVVRCLEATSWQVFRKVRLPTALPYIFGGFKISITLCVVGAVVAEFLGAEVGLGHLIATALVNADTALIFASFMLLSIMGLALYGALEAAERFAVPWRTAEMEVIPGF